MKRIIALLAIAIPAVAQQSYSPYVDRQFPDTVYWGDTHVHTYLSIDAYAFGTRITPDQAYRFARGETIRATGGEEARIRRPLDFLMVADHAQNLGVFPALDAGDELLLASEDGQRFAGILAQAPALRDVVRAGTVDEYSASSKVFGAAKAGFDGKFGIDDTFKRGVWADIVAVAERHNDPGKFTTFAGYEYSTSMLHRNVLFVGGPTETLKTLPFSKFDSPNPEDLWSNLERYREMTGSDVIAIPHNSNLSRGNMFRTVTFEGKAISPEYARTRSSIEPIIEVTQIKGDSETHPLISPTDEFADHETLGNLTPPSSLFNTADTKSKASGSTPAQEIASSVSPVDLATASYARSALQTGLDIEADIGVNPYKFGMIGSSDTHNGLASVDEDNYWGKMGPHEPGPYRVDAQPNYSSSGYAAVWAAENTREAIFAAMKRREVYATTGPRMTLRFFAGWDFEENDALRPDIAKAGYSMGVPMGGDLIQSEGTRGKPPTFLIRATRDPDGANLDRVQIVKGWRDQDGTLMERVYDVAWSGDRSIGSDGLLPAVGSTVQPSEASYQNTIGSPELSAVWTDPAFDEAEAAVYYVRVLQIPTPRWTTYDAAVYGLKEIPQEQPVAIQERAYSSPIWYTPR